MVENAQKSQTFLGCSNPHLTSCLCSSMGGSKKCYLNYTPPRRAAAGGGVEMFLGRTEIMVISEYGLLIHLSRHMTSQNGGGKGNWRWRPWGLRRVSEKEKVSNKVSNVFPAPKLCISCSSSNFSLLSETASVRKKNRFFFSLFFPPLLPPVWYIHGFKVSQAQQSWLIKTCLVLGQRKSVFLSFTLPSFGVGRQKRNTGRKERN